MADANYPLPGFHFSVDFGGTIINCNEVSGLDMEVEVIEYRAGDDQKKLSDEARDWTCLLYTSPSPRDRG